ILGLLDVPTSGRYRFEGADVGLASDRLRSRLRARRIGFVFQSFHLLGRTTALENVEMPTQYLGARPAAAVIRCAPPPCWNGWGWAIGCAIIPASFPEASSSGSRSHGR